MACSFIGMRSCHHAPAPRPKRKKALPLYWRSAVDKSQDKGKATDQTHLTVKNFNFSMRSLPVFADRYNMGSPSLSMPRTDDGEFELILGNRQLLSVFFLVVILLAVFFTLGYVVGRGSGAPGTPEIAKDRRDTKDLPVVEAPTASAKASPVERPAVEPQPQPAAPETAKPVTKETAKTTVPEPVKPAAKPEVITAKTAEAPKPEPPKPAPSAVASAEPQLLDPQPGQVFIQVGATTRAEALLIAQSLTKKSFPAVVAQTPDKSKYRILVGPLPAKDTGAISKAKSDMESLGFNKPFVQKYK